MLAEFSIHPMQTEHMSKAVAQVIEILEGTGLNYHLGPMSTAVEGSWEQVLAAIQGCHQAVAKDHSRIITTIVIDDRKDHPHHLGEMISSVEQQLGHKTKH